MLQNPNLILLDEPTNHLDVQTVEWLEEFLLQVVEQGLALFGFKSKERELEPVAYVIISHDRALLDSLVNKILEIEHGEVKQYSGNYEEYSQLKLEFLATEEKTKAKMANTMRRELEWLRSGTKARTTKQTARIERAKALDTKLIAKDKKLSLYKNAQITFNAQMLDQHRDKDDFIVTREHNLGEQELIKLNSLTIRRPANELGEKLLFKNLDLILKPRVRIAILGPNGSGKSTLLNYIVENINPFEGEIKFHDLCKISYFDQKRNNLNFQETVRKNIAPEGDNVFFSGKYMHIMSYLERFLFYKFDVNKIVSELSGGEQARLLLAKLMLEQGNVLILDEPTNDLDIPTLQVLERNLIEFNGAVLFTSHDRYFMQKVSTSILTFIGEKNNIPYWRVCPDLNQALNEIELFQMEKEKLQKSEINLKNQGFLSSPIPVNPEKKKLSFKEKREHENIEKNIDFLEKNIHKLSTQLDDAYASGKSYQETKILSDEISLLQEKLDLLYLEWEKLI